MYGGCLLCPLYPLLVWKNYRKILKIIPGAYFFKGPFWGAYFRRGLSTEENLRFKIDWTSLIVGSKFTVFALFYFVSEGIFPSTSPRGAYIWRGDLTEGFLRYGFGGLLFRGAYTLRGLFSEFYSNWIRQSNVTVFKRPNDLVSYCTRWTVDGHKLSLVSTDDRMWRAML